MNSPLRRRVRHLSLFVTAILVTLVGHTLLRGAPDDTGANAQSALQPMQWRVEWTDDPATTATVSWSTVEPGRVHRVHFSTADGEQKGVAECRHNGPFSAGGRDDTPQLHYHHAKLLNLHPATRYNLVLESDGQRSPPLYFITAATDDRPLGLLFGGDSRSGRDARRAINQRIAKLVQSNPAIMALAHGGDFVASGQNLAQWSDWMADYTLTTTDDGRLLPIVPCRGNHDGGPLFDEVFDFDDSHNYYAISFGSQLWLVTLNSNISAAGDQAQWLTDELRRSRPRYRWLLAQYHRPAYPAVKTPGAALQHWVPLFEKYDLDMACEADGHTIKRTPPIRDNHTDPTGVVYIGEGGLGVAQRTPKTDRWYLKPPGKAGSGHHVQLLLVSRTQLEYQAILSEGDLFDRYVLHPRAAREPAEAGK